MKHSIVFTGLQQKRKQTTSIFRLQQRLLRCFCCWQQIQRCI